MFDEEIGPAYDIHATDLNHDGQLDLVVSTHEEAGGGAVYAYERLLPPPPEVSRDPPEVSRGCGPSDHGIVLRQTDADGRVVAWCKTVMSMEFNVTRPGPRQAAPGFIYPFYVTYDGGSDGSSDSRGEVTRGNFHSSSLGVLGVSHRQLRSGRKPHQSSGRGSGGIARRPYKLHRRLQAPRTLIQRGGGGDRRGTIPSGNESRGCPWWLVAGDGSQAMHIIYPSRLNCDINPPRKDFHGRNFKSRTGSQTELATTEISDSADKHSFSTENNSGPGKDWSIKASEQDTRWTGGSKQYKSGALALKANQALSTVREAGLDCVCNVGAYVTEQLFFYGGTVGSLALSDQVAPGSLAVAVADYDNGQVFLYAINPEPGYSIHV